jgi:nucleoside-diphosphate-sugar epimerase
MAAIVSGEAERNLDLGMQINFHASLQLLELCRKMDFCPRIVYASSCAVFGGEVDQLISDDRGPSPQSSYGTQKAMVELLMSDYSRKGFLDARCLRLPTIAIRPGKPNAATSSFVSSIVREPLNGLPATCPVPEDTRMWIQSPRSVIQNFLHAALLDENQIEKDRILNLPGLTISVKELIQSLEEVAGSGVTRLINFEPDAFIQSIVLTWPSLFEAKKALSLGFEKDQNAVDIVRAYVEEEGIVFKN